MSNNRILQSVDLARMEYQAAWDLQAKLQALQIDGALGPVILSVEHPPTITVGRRGTQDEVVAPAPVLRQRGVAVVETDRGGQVTYHGPGQLVVYPLVHVEAIGLHEYLRLLEDAVMRTVARWGIEGYRVEGRTGVWVGKEKICAMGIRVRRWWAIHGLALNVTTDLNHFGLIIPCGIRDRGVGSMEKLLGDKTPPMALVRQVLLEEIAEALGMRLVETELAALGVAHQS
ncbi:lipoyl(octanoyl) transferase LipB [bacterium]|nr:lipoyl(octanoyl) transferase LipB [bacterium]